jgi:hypothetical protein
MTDKVVRKEPLTLENVGREATKGVTEAGNHDLE